MSQIYYPSIIRTITMYCDSNDLFRLYCAIPKTRRIIEEYGEQWYDAGDYEICKTTGIHQYIKGSPEIVEAKCVNGCDLTNIDLPITEQIQCRNFDEMVFAPRLKNLTAIYVDASFPYPSVESLNIVDFDSSIVPIFPNLKRLECINFEIDEGDRFPHLKYLKVNGLPRIIPQSVSELILVLFESPAEEYDYRNVEYLTIIIDSKLRDFSFDSNHRFKSITIRANKSNFMIYRVYCNRLTIIKKNNQYYISDNSRIGELLIESPKFYTQGGTRVCRGMDNPFPNFKIEHALFPTILPVILLERSFYYKNVSDLITDFNSSYSIFLHSPVYIHTLPRIFTAEADIYCDNFEHSEGISFRWTRFNNVCDLSSAKKIKYINITILAETKIIMPDYCKTILLTSTNYGKSIVADKIIGNYVSISDVKCSYLSAKYLCINGLIECNFDFTRLTYLAMENLRNVKLDLSEARKLKKLYITCCDLEKLILPNSMMELRMNMVNSPNEIMIERIDKFYIINSCVVIRCLSIGKLITDKSFKGITCGNIEYMWFPSNRILRTWYYGFINCAMR